MESVETLNRRLEDFYGKDSDTNRAIFRIVWSEDQTEKRKIDTLDSGIFLLQPEVREVKKYPYIKNLYVLERLVLVPIINERDLPVSKMSYEPLWVYRTDKGEPRPPVWPMTKLVIDTLYAAMGDPSELRKYVDSEKNTTIEGRDQRITELQAELFGNETDTADALRYKQGVTVPPNYKSGE